MQQENTESSAGVPEVQAPSIEKWLSDVMNCRKNTDRQRTAALILHEELLAIETSDGVPGIDGGQQG